MKLSILNVLIIFVVICGGGLFFAGDSRVMAQTDSPEAVVKTFYNGYTRALAKNVDPLGKNSTIKKHLSSKLTSKKIKAFGNKMEADYFFQSQEFDDGWVNNFTVSKPAVRGATATALVTFPQGYPRVKVTLAKEAGAWKIRSVQNAQQ